jgi:hypothetical protein
MFVGNWIRGLSRIEAREDLPITLGGGEPTIYEGFYNLVGKLTVPMDLLTNATFNVYKFIFEVPTDTFYRKAKYASIRISLHKHVDVLPIVLKAFALQNEGYQVGIWGFRESFDRNRETEQLCRDFNIDFRYKELLSSEEGTYKYPDAHTKKFRRKVMCRPSEMLIGPSGHIYRCHSDLYAGRNPYAHILDDKVQLPTDFMPCENYGHCSPCDSKQKFDRFQQPNHCSIEIKEIEHSIQNCKGY